ncbi:MAG: arsenic efflux protein [Kiritimatiellae bacterium]|nr:arsenic efflux protein [Kiritimatiellia bacterium]
MDVLISTLKHAFMITGFVGVMMLVIEYVNVLTQGRWQERISHRRWGQYLLASLLGATPGCLGAFAVVAMYSHRTLSIGAVVAAMIATAGDESFVMFAMIPGTALPLHGILFLLGIASGALTDAILGRRLTARLSCKTDFAVHEEDHCTCFPHGRILAQWKHCSPTRGTLSISLALFLAAIVAGQIGPPAWNWIRASLAVVSAVAMFIVVTVPDHFLEDHLWRHVVRGHIPRIFLWTLGAMLFLHLVVDQWQIADTIQENQWIVLGIAGLVGIIPESGPHLVFVTMFAKGLIPFSILLTSSIVQDGHGMLPLLAHSRRAFIVIKLINLMVGLALGATLMRIGR